MESGDSFGRYLIREKIGEGGMGEVYLADDTRLNRQVALKVLARAVAGDDERLRRFEQEAQAASALNHPNILTVHEFGEENGLAYLASEFVEGSTLRELIALSELDLRTGLKIVEQTAFALDTAHAAGIIHRDIKPENIMIRKDGFVKILDFGLAKLVEQVEAKSEDETRAHFKTAAGHIVGTATYMSPEQARGLADIDARTDVWSLGIVIHEMFAGRPPFTGDTISDVIASVLKTDAQPLANLVEDCPPELDRIVTKSLRKDREERYQVIKDLALDIRALRKQLEFSAEYGRSIGGTPGMLTSELSRAHTTGFVIPARSPFWFVGAALVLVAAIASGAWFAFSKYSGSTETDAASLKTVELVNWASQPGEIYAYGSFSPDGRMIAFASTKSGNKQIWVKQTTTGEAVQVTSDDAVFAGNPIWSPDGDEIAFYSNRNGRPGFWRIPVLGGAPTLIAYLEDGSSQPRSWSRDGSIYFGSASALNKAEVGSGKVEKVISLGTETVKAGQIDLSPDERHVAYVINESEKYTLAYRGVADGEPAKLVTTDTRIRDVVWHQDSQRVLYSASTNGIFQIFVVGLDGLPPRQVTFSERDTFALDVSSDGAKIMVSSAKEDSDLWSVNLADGKESNFVSDVDSELWPAVSPDGKAVAYQSVKNLNQGNNLAKGSLMMRRGADRATPVQIAGDVLFSSFAPNGQWIAFIRVMGSKYQIEVTGAAGGEKSRVVAESIVPPAYAVLPYVRVHTNDFDWAPDNSRIAYVSRRSGHANIWVSDIEGTASQLTANSDPALYFYSPIWSSDGKHVAFTSRTGTASVESNYGVWVVDAESRIARQIFEGETAIRLLAWERDDTSLVLSTTVRQESGASYGEVALSSIAVDTGTRQEIRSIRNAYAHNMFVLPDKRRILFTAYRDGKDDIWTVPIGGGTEKKITDNNNTRLYFSSLAFSPGNEMMFFGKQSRYSLLSMITNFN